MLEIRLCRIKNPNNNQGQCGYACPPQSLRDRMPREPWSGRTPPTYIRIRGTPRDLLRDLLKQRVGHPRGILCCVAGDQLGAGLADSDVSFHHSTSRHSETSDMKRVDHVDGKAILGRTQRYIKAGSRTDGV